MASESIMMYPICQVMSWFVSNELSVYTLRRNVLRSILGYLGAFQLPLSLLIAVLSSSIESLRIIISVACADLLMAQVTSDCVRLFHENDALALPNPSKAEFFGIIESFQVYSIWSISTYSSSLLRIGIPKKLLPFYLRYFDSKYELILAISDSESHSPAPIVSSTYSLRTHEDLLLPRFSCK